MTTIFLRVANQNKKLIRDYAKLKKSSVYDLMRNATTKKMEHAMDAENFDRILANMETVHPLDDVKKELGF